jgi:hypothetical protein
MWKSGQYTRVYTPYTIYPFNQGKKYHEKQLEIWNTYLLDENLSLGTFTRCNIGTNVSQYIKDSHFEIENNHSEIQNPRIEKILQELEILRNKEINKFISKVIVIILLLLFIKYSFTKLNNKKSKRKRHKLSE